MGTVGDLWFCLAINPTVHCAGLGGLPGRGMTGGAHCMSVRPKDIPYARNIALGRPGLYRAAYRTRRELGTQPIFQSLSGSSTFGAASYIN